MDIERDTSPAPPRWFLPLLGIAFVALAFAGVSKALLQGPCKRLIYETCAKAGIPCPIVNRLVQRSDPDPEICETSSRQLEKLLNQEEAFTAFSETLGIEDIQPILERAAALSAPPVSPEDEAALIALGPLACGNAISRWHADPSQGDAMRRVLTAIRGEDPGGVFEDWQVWCAVAFDDAWLATAEIN